MQFEGIYTPVITPFHNDGSVDKEGFAEVLEFLIDAGTHGIVVAGTTGEYYAQTTEERTHLMQYAHQVINCRLPMMVGVNQDRGFNRARTNRETDRCRCAIGQLTAYVLPTKLRTPHTPLLSTRPQTCLSSYNYPANGRGNG